MIPGLQKSEEFKCDTCGAPCIRVKGARNVLENQCWWHASEAEQQRRRVEQGELDLGLAA